MIDSVCPAAGYFTCSYPLNRLEEIIESIDSISRDGPDISYMY